MSTLQRPRPSVATDRPPGAHVLNRPILNKGTAARELGEHSTARTDPSGSLLPALRDIRSVARAIATAVGLEAQLAGVAPKTSSEKLRDQVSATQWTPEYRGTVLAG
jgi:malic enzyme